MRATTFLTALHRRVDSAMFWLAALALLAMMALATADALLRYLANAPVAGAHELADEFLMPAIIYFAMAAVYAMGGHIRITILADLLPVGVQRALLCLFDAITACIFAMISYGLWRRTFDAWDFNEYSTSPLNYLLAPSYAIVAIGSLAMTVRLATAAATMRHPDPGTLSLDH